MLGHRAELRQQLGEVGLIVIDGELHGPAADVFVLVAEQFVNELGGDAAGDIERPHRAQAARFIGVRGRDFGEASAD